MIYLDDLRSATGGQLFGEGGSDRFTGLCHDVRQAKPGSLFVALRTETDDGHRWIEQALAAGATGILCHEPPKCDVSRATVILVGDTSVALGQWAAYVLRQYGTMIIGVVGSLGKSWACEAIATILETRYAVYRCRQSLSGQYNMLLDLGDLAEDHQIAVLELKGQPPGEMSRLLTIVRPQMIVLTTTDPVGPARGWGSPVDVQQEARQALEALPDNGMAVLNVNDSHTLDLQRFSRIARLTYGQASDNRAATADLSACNVACYLDRTAFDLRYADQELKNCHLPVLARAGLSVALSALSVGLLYDIPLEEGLQALSNLRSLPGRLSLLEGVRGSFLVDDTACANPAAALAALEWLAGVDIGGRRKLVILGNLAGQGEEAIHAHMEIGLKAAQSADFLIACGEMACVAGRAACRAGMLRERVSLLYDAGEIAETALRNLSSPGDLVLVSGGQREQMGQAVRRLLKDPAAWGEMPPPNHQGMPAEPLYLDWPSWIELNLQEIAHNIQEIRRRLVSGVGVMAVVEANAYGHGAVQVATAAQGSGVTMLGVASLGEGIELRRCGIDAPILILGQIFPHQARQAVISDLTVSIHDTDGMRALAQAARGLGRVAGVHLCIDVSNGECGIAWEQVASLVRDLVRLEVLVIEGIYTSLPSSGDRGQNRDVREQMARFTVVYNSLHASGLSIPHVHVDTTTAITMPEIYLTMARIGPALVGLESSTGPLSSMPLHSAMSWKTSVIRVSVLPTKEKVAIIPVGYADGLRTKPDAPNKVLLRGQRVSIVGCMAANRSMIYTSSLPDVQIGDEVVMLGRQGNDEIRASDMAGYMGVTSLEVICSISARVPRVIG
ncbi:MAG: alanine racemase [Anaerolineae bacterium]|nr:alanine racemase [Anaerolineae bacterium]